MDTRVSIHFNYKMEQYSMPGTHCDSFAIHAHVPHIKIKPVEPGHVQTCQGDLVRVHTSSFI